MLIVFNDVVLLFVFGLVIVMYLIDELMLKLIGMIILCIF